MSNTMKNMIEYCQPADLDVSDDTIEFGAAKLKSQIGKVHST